VTAPESGQPGTVMRGGALLAAGMAVSNAFGYGLNLVASRALGPDEFGAFASLMGIVLVCFVGSMALQSVTARRLATDGPAAAAAMLGLGRRCAVGIAAALVVTAPAWSAVLHLAAAQILLVAATMIPLTLVGIRFGLAQGSERFGALALLYVLVAAGRLGGTLVGLAVRDSVTSGLVGALAGASAAALLAARVAPLPHPPRDVPEPGAASELMIAAGALFAFFALTNVDVLLARHQLSEHEAGLYALGAVVAKGAFWFPQFIAVLAYPMLVDEARRRGAIRLSLALVATSGALITTGAALFPHVVVSAVGGDEYRDLAHRVALFALAGSLFALAQLLIYARLAKGDPRAGVAVAAVLIGLVVTVQVAANDSVTQIVLTVCAAAAALSLVGVVSERRALTRPVRTRWGLGPRDRRAAGHETDAEDGARSQREPLDRAASEQPAGRGDDPERQQPAR
jgi:O-antigen/teichoic acid export membrane protein